jgi:hypothetical protein
VCTALGSAPTAYAATSTVAAMPSATPMFDGAVQTVAYAGTTVFVGGDFHNAVVGSKRYARARLAAFDALTGALLPWTPSADATVRALAVDPVTGALYLGGDFGTVDGQPRARLAVLDPVTGTLGAFSHPVAGTVRALAVGSGRVYAGGHFTSVDSVPVGNIVAFRGETGVLDPAFTASTSDTIDALAAAGTRLYLGGTFKLVDGATGTPKLAALDVRTGARDPTFKPKVSVKVFAVAAGPAGVYAALGGQGGRVIAFGATGSALWTTTADGDVQALALLNDVVYIGGHFDNVCLTNLTGAQGACTEGAVSRVKLAALDASNGRLLPWDPRGNGVHGVLAMAADPDLHLVAAAGEFTTIGGVRRARFAQFT